MRRRRFPVFVVSVGLALVFFTFLRPLFGQPTPTAPVADSDEYQEVELQPTSGSPVKGKLLLAALTVTTETGSTTIKMKHVKRITFPSDPDGKAPDTVQLLDKSIVRGHVAHESFAVKIPSAEQPLQMKRSEVREIKTVAQERLSLVAVLLGLLTLTAMEIVLGVDNIIFLAIIAGKLPKEQQPRARKIGLAAALGTRILLLGSLWLLLGLTAPLFTLPDFGVLHDMEAREVSWRDLILLGGGLFLIGKSTYEMHSKMEEAKAERDGQPVLTSARKVSFGWTIFTIAVIDIVFSLDSVITAVGMVDSVPVMIAAMVIAMLVMLYFAGPIAEFVDRHPTIKVLALSFLILIGVMLVAEGLGQHIDKGYIYVAMGFALLIELVNMRFRGVKESPSDSVESPKVESRKVEDTPPSGL